MRRNSQSHLDDIAKRFAATAPRPREEEPSLESTDFDHVDANQQSMDGRTRLLYIVFTLACLVAAAVVGLLLLRR